VGSSEASTLASRLFEQHGRAIHRYLQRMTGDRASADDLAQEVFLRVARAAGTYQPTERERAWVFRIAQNVVLDERKRQQRVPPASTALEPQTRAAQSVRFGVREALARLPPEDREAFLLAEVGGLTYAEIAAAFDSTVPAVRSRIYRARIALRELLAPPAPAGPGACPPRYEEDD
jgi:RNA polymerase sigma-70 factor, ECF subfamily